MASQYIVNTLSQPPLVRGTRMHACMHAFTTTMVPMYISIAQS
jgi:hypothetical protein